MYNLLRDNHEMWLYNSFNIIKYLQRELLFRIFILNFRHAHGLSLGKDNFWVLEWKRQYSPAMCTPGSRTPVQKPTNDTYFGLRISNGYRKDREEFCPSLEHNNVNANIISYSVVNPLNYKTTKNKWGKIVFYGYGT